MTTVLIIPTCSSVLIQIRVSWGGSRFLQNGPIKSGAPVRDTREILEFLGLGNALSAVSPEFVGIMKSLNMEVGCDELVAKCHHVVKSLVHSDSLS